MLNKTNTLILILFISFAKGFAGAYGYRFKTVGLFVGINSYSYTSTITGGFNIDRFHKNCISSRTYEGIQFELGFISTRFDHSGLSIKLSKGIRQPWYLTRQTTLHPVISLNGSYTIYEKFNNYSIRPEIGFVLAKPIMGLLASRLMVFDGYELPIKKHIEKQVRGNVIGLKIIVSIDFSRIKKIINENEEQTE